VNDERRDSTEEVEMMAGGRRVRLDEVEKSMKLAQETAVYYI